MFNYRPGVFQLKMWDANQLDILPVDWAFQIERVARGHAKDCTLEGKSSTSREPENSSPITLRVVTGTVIRRELPWLYDAYSGPLRLLAQELINKELAVARDLNSSVNINLISGKGNRYERHVDSNPVTGILYASTLREDDGGALVYDHKNGSDVIYPRTGVFIAFDALNTPHYVAPMKASCDRLSVPMNFYLAGEPQKRPNDLDDYLYVERP